MTSVPTVENHVLGQRTDGAGSASTDQPPRKSTSGMWVERPDRHTVVVGACGELEVLRTPRFAALLSPRLAAEVHTVIIDLSQVSFLGVDALKVLINAQRRTRVRGIDLRLVTGPVAVHRALRAAGLHTCLELYSACGKAVPEHSTSAA